MINNKYISRALNPSVSNQPEAQSAVHVQLRLSKVHVQLKLSKQRNQRHPKTKQYIIHKYISRALNPSVSNLYEDQSALHVQLKLSKLHTQLKPSKQRK